MTTILLFKDLYNEAFKNLGNIFSVNIFKVMSWFCFSCIAVILYAFVYRLATGFAF